MSLLRPRTDLGVLGVLLVLLGVTVAGVVLARRLGVPVVLPVGVGVLLIALLAFGAAH